MSEIYPVQRIVLIQALIPLLYGSPSWEDRWNIEWYVSKCITAGFCKTDDQARQCASRYIDGKRKVTPPGTAKRKRDAKRMSQILANVPPELAKAVRDVVAEQTKVVERYRAGVEKALNSLVGGVITRHKSDPTIVRELLIKEINKV